MSAVRDTSARSLEQHEASGKAGTQREWVLAYIREHGPCTRRMAATALGIETASVSSAVHWLLRDRKITEVGKMQDPETKKTVYALEACSQQRRLW